MSSIVINDGLDRGIQPWTEHEQSKSENDYVEERCGDLQWTRPEITTVQMPVRYCPEDEAEETVKGGAH